MAKIYNDVIIKGKERKQKSKRKFLKKIFNSIKAQKKLKHFMKFVFFSSVRKKGIKSINHHINISLRVGTFKFLIK